MNTAVEDFYKYIPEVYSNYCVCIEYKGYDLRIIPLNFAFNQEAKELYQKLEEENLIAKSIQVDQEIIVKAFQESGKDFTEEQLKNILIYPRESGKRQKAAEANSNIKKTRKAWHPNSTSNDLPQW